MTGSLSTLLRENDEPARLVADGEIDIKTIDEFTDSWKSALNALTLYFEDRITIR